MLIQFSATYLEKKYPLPEPTAAIPADRCASTRLVSVWRQNMSYRRATARAMLLVVLAATAAATATASGAAGPASLPLEYRYLNKAVPDPGVRSALADFLDGLPAQLCALAPADLATLPLRFMDEVRAHAHGPRMRTHAWHAGGRHASGRDSSRTPTSAHGA